MKCIMSVDVEDWFHILNIPSAPKPDDWDALPSIVEDCMMRLLDIFSAADVRVTCFFLGWVAQKYPNLVREADRRGHEIASHGFGHRLVYELGTDAFLEDTHKAKHVIEDITGRPVQGYRAAGFSVTEATPWFFDALARAGHTYDASVFPLRRGHGGMPTAEWKPHRVTTPAGDITEFPMTVVHVGGERLCVFGGGYFRLTPYALIRRATRQILKEQRPAVFYLHPREIDPDHPRLQMNFARRFKSYVNLGATEWKLKSLLDDFEFETFESHMKTRHQSA
jgi:polysaccharide deacetylase family protein (PEP-CTERM system associated)